MKAELEKKLEEILKPFLDGQVVYEDGDGDFHINSVFKAEILALIQAEKEALLDELISDYEAPLKNDPNPNPTATLIWEKIVEEFKTRKSELGEKK